MGEMGILVALAIAVVALLWYDFSLRASLAEIARELEDKLKTDTNTRISLSSGNRATCALAAQINDQLLALRKERLKMQHGDAELKTAVANLSHDLRTPLTSICGYLDLLEQEELPENARRYLAVMRERTAALRALTEELLRYSMAAQTADSLDAQPVCLQDILEQSLAGFYGVLTARGIQPEIHLCEEAVVRMADKNALRRVFDNLLSNAAKYSDGDLTVRLQSDGTVILENSAQTLNPVQTERLFDRFYTVQTANGSAGLGLSIARLLTEKMGGRITAGYQAGRLRVCVRFLQREKPSIGKDETKV